MNLRTFARLATRTLLRGALLSWSLLAPLAWILRDGLGPDSGPPSTGLTAIQRTCITLGWGPTLLALALANLLHAKFATTLLTTTTRTTGLLIAASLILILLGWAAFGSAH